MSLIDTVTQFNQLSDDLPALQAFIGVVQAGHVSINTDGSGHYWAVVPRYNPDTGAADVADYIPLNIVSGLTSASNALSTLLGYVNAATVNPNPPSGAISA